MNNHHEYAFCLGNILSFSFQITSDNGTQHC
jgi:hypothetical protein